MMDDSQAKAQEGYTVAAEVGQSILYSSAYNLRRL